MEFEVELNLKFGIELNYQQLIDRNPNINVSCLPKGVYSRYGHNEMQGEEEQR